MAGFSPETAFINVPYDDRFQDLYLAYIAGLASFGLEPKATLYTPFTTCRAFSWTAHGRRPLDSTCRSSWVLFLAG